MVSYSTILDIVLAVFTSYSLTFLVASSSIFYPIRKQIMLKIPKLKIGDYKHFIECRMCIGFWISLFTCLFFALPFSYVLAIYGGSYFLATQER